MNYIWEAVTHTKRNGISERDVRFVPAKRFSPYMEVNPEDLNEKYLSEGFPVEVNPYVRFYKIFKDYLDPELQGFSEYRESLFDILIHMLLAIDRKSGYDHRALLRIHIRDDIQNGCYGSGIASLFRMLNDKEHDVIADGLISLYHSGSSIYLHGVVCRKLFPDHISYLRTERELLLYLGIEKTPHMEAAALLCQQLFLPVDMVVHYYWTRHFGVVGMDETMMLNNIILF